MMFLVPPKSLKNLAEMSKFLSQKNIPLNGGATRIAFDTNTNDVLTFKIVGFLDVKAFLKAQSLMRNDVVLAIVGKPILFGAYVASVTDADAPNLNQAAEESASKAP